MAATELVKGQRVSFWKRFQRFAQGTTLHGWAYIAESSNFLETGLWLATLLGLNILSAVFIVNNTAQYIESGIKTTIESTTESLDNVHFPSVTVCNINQVDTCPSNHGWPLFHSFGL